MSGAGKKRRQEGTPRTHRAAAVKNGSEQESKPQARSWAAVVARIRRDDPRGVEELYRVFSHGVRFYLCRHVGPDDLDDRVHDIFLIVLEAIRRGDLREPERLMGFVRTIVRRQVAAYIDNAVHCRRDHLELIEGIQVPDRHHDPETAAMERERADLMASVLRSINTRDREILTRFYLLGQPSEQIRLEMSLTETQFRLLKSRAKRRFGQQGRKQIDMVRPAQNQQSKVA